MRSSFRVFPLPAFKSLRLALFLLLGFCLIPGRSWAALSINQVRFGTHPDKTRLVLDLSGKTDFRVFTLESPYRLLIDLPDFQWNAGNASTTPSSSVRALRYGTLQPGISRIVFEMTRPVAVESAFFIPAQGSQPGRLVIDYAPASGKKFQDGMKHIRGTLHVAGENVGEDMTVYQDRAPKNLALPAHAVSTLTPPAVSPPPAPDSIVRKPLIIIDPGHGGVDPGAISAHDANEKNITLALARALKKQLESTGRYRVALTRDKDVFIKLRDRVTFAREREAELFISLHADSIGKPDVSGVSVYTLSEKASDKQTAKLAEQENRADLIAGLDLSTEDEDVAGILVDLAMRDTMNQSNFFANKIIEKLRAGSVSLLEKPHRSAGFAVLKAPDIPSVLVETGFMSNKKEAALLATPAHREKIAHALCGAVDSYFEQVRKNQKI
jgi:N-acetylmuramoyl-L-alanine amidase